MKPRISPYLMSKPEAEHLVLSATPDTAAAAARLARLPLATWNALPVIRRALDLTRLGEVAAAQRLWARNHTDWGASGNNRRPREVSPTQWEQFR